MPKINDYKDTCVCIYIYSPLWARFLSIPLSARFLSKLWMTNANGEGSFQGAELLGLFKEWAQAKNFDVKMTFNTLAGELGKLAENGVTSGVSKSRSGGRSTYTFRMWVLLGYLEGRNMLDGKVF
mmetsp:Transcript_21684/g.50304  ORF Transcript_21684/g.50304 Transcript_21684/m.50304 type:complete len:125 (-) Transcript_21684:206-580(-)